MAKKHGPKKLKTCKRTEGGILGQIFYMNHVVALIMGDQELLMELKKLPPFLSAGLIFFIILCHTSQHQF